MYLNVNDNKTLMEKLTAAEPIFWKNEKKNIGLTPTEITADDIEDAERRLHRFAPLIMKLFPETVRTGGIIESPLCEIAGMGEVLHKDNGAPAGRLLIKLDSNLAVAGSVKARGGIYEVLKHTEDIALANGLINEDSDYSVLSSYREFFSGYTVQVGSTGNLGMSIGISAAAIGFNTVVHMSADAKEWKKEKLRRNGVDVREYSGDYSKAVEQGRKLSDSDEKSYFVDDEKSKTLFIGYATAGKRFAAQLEKLNIKADGNNKLNIYLPCGVGGAPGGITFGLKQIYGDNVRCYYVEPVECPCMALGLITEKYGGICVSDIGLSGKTSADGLAVGRCSELVCRMTKNLTDGCFTVRDEVLPEYQRLLYRTENIFIEPSSCVSFDAYTRAGEISDENTTHIIWATGGSLVPPEVRQTMLKG